MKKILLCQNNLNFDGDFLYLLKLDLKSLYLKEKTHLHKKRRTPDLFTSCEINDIILLTYLDEKLLYKIERKAKG